MSKFVPVIRYALAFLVLSGVTASAQPSETDHSISAEAQKQTGAPAPLVVYFEPGSSTLRQHDQAILDRASRAYNDGRPIVMIITGTADRTGSAAANLSISQRRAGAVLRALLDRGIPADRFQLIAKGETELPVKTPEGVAEHQNRRVEISWH